ncbi:hypothetical protein [Sutterella wadsworthensis]|uniref:hypothetical protein n=1 Tax=Sutterella wadsworthensis TaxID=40545 RepID=UPI003AAA6F10
MGWKASFSVRVSGLEDGTLTDVLEAVAVFVDDRDLTSECYPAITSIMTIARKSRNVVRAALKELVNRGLLSFRQENGEKRYYRVHLNLLPPSKIATFRTEPGKELTPVQKCTGFKSEPGPGSEVNPEERRNRELNREEEKSSDAHTCEAPPFDDELFNEAARVASESLGSEVNVEVVCSAIGQTPIENIDALFATTSDSLFGTDTPTKDQNAAERKSEACSKPKQPRKERIPRVRFPEDIPDDWRVDAQKLRPEIDAQATFTKMRCWLGANNTTTKTMRQWKTQFLGWIGREKKGFEHYAGNHRSDRSRQGYAGFGARNTAEIDYNYGLPVRGAVG